ncbi:MAG TPA: hypothetical protein VIH20_02500 [Candidatus Subteraquimicrobiales bacterium]
MSKIKANDNGFEKELATGDVASKGTYTCENCGKSFKHDGEKPLPPCPSCKIWTLYLKKQVSN